MKLNEDILSNIINCVDCIIDNHLFLVNNKLNKLYFKFTSCHLLEFKNLHCCNFHLKYPQRLNTIKSLLQAQNDFDIYGFTSTIHFNDHLEMKIAEPYLSSFGKISHKCCGGKGVMYDIPTVKRDLKSYKKLLILK